MFRAFGQPFKVVFDAKACNLDLHAVKSKSETVFIRRIKAGVDPETMASYTDGSDYTGVLVEVTSSDAAIAESIRQTRQDSPPPALTPFPLDLIPYLNDTGLQVLTDKMVKAVDLARAKKSKKAALAAQKVLSAVNVEIFKRSKA